MHIEQKKKIDELMADRGFTIGNLLFNIKAHLNIPAFTNKGAQLSKEDVTNTERIVNV